MYIIVQCTCALILIGDMPTEPMIEISVTDRRGGRSQTAAAAATAMIDEHIGAENEDDSDEELTDINNLPDSALVCHVCYITVHNSVVYISACTVIPQLIVARLLCEVLRYGCTP